MCGLSSVGGQGISQPVWWLKCQESSASDIQQELLRVLGNRDCPQYCAQLQHMGTPNN